MAVVAKVAVVVEVETAGSDGCWPCCSDGAPSCTLWAMGVLAGDSVKPALLYMSKKTENEIKHKSVIQTTTLVQYSITFALLYAISDILIVIFGVNVEVYSLGYI